MHDATFRNLLLAGALTILPGCLAINAALGVFGVLGPPAAQLAGAAYTVAEYSYEYGAHDRTPDEVLLAKFDWLLEDDGDEPDPAAFAGALRRTVDGPPMVDAPRPVMAAEAAPVARSAVRSVERPVAWLVTRSVKQPVARPIAAPVAEPITAPMAVAVAKQPMKPKRAAAPRTAAVQGKVAVPPARTAPPIHTYVAHTPDPLQTRLDRWENGLAQAERLLLSQTEDGLRLSVPPLDGEPSAQGVNGGSSLRLPVMRTAPAASPALSARAG